MSAGECTIERYKQDRNGFFLLITNKCKFRCCGSFIERSGPLKLQRENEVPWLLN